MINLILKAILGFVFLILCLGLALFVSAGSLSFWQAWVFLALFTISFIPITAYLVKYDQQLLAGRVKAVTTAETQKAQQIIATLADIFFIGMFIVPGLDFRFHWSNVPIFVILISDGIVALSILIVFLVFRENSYTSAIIEVTKEQKVISSGPYSVVRHPMYSGAILFMIFAPLALGSWATIPFSLPYILTVVVRLREEEKFLAVNLSGYNEYRQKVRYRLIPFVW